MPEGTPNPKGYTGLTPYSFLTSTVNSGLTQTVKPSDSIAQNAAATKLTQEQKTKTTKEKPSAKNAEKENVNAPENATVNETPPDEGNADNEQGTPPEAQTESVKINPPKPSTAPSGEKTKDENPKNTVYKIQLGAFSTKENAQTLINELKGKGVDATVVPLKKDGKDYFRVQAGAYKNKESADKLANDLKHQGYPVFVSGQ